jgi:hypothetical protein
MLLARMGTEGLMKHLHLFAFDSQRSMVDGERPAGLNWSWPAGEGAQPRRKAMQRLAEFAGIEGGDFFAQDLGMQKLLQRLLPGEERGPVCESLHDGGRRSGR